jgi:pyrroloquinoline quinone (PQQ) biosynthesis protein C
MSTETIEEIIPRLTDKDRKLLYEFAKTLLKSDQYKSFREELEKRRKEIEKGQTLTHEELWGEI